MHGDDKVIAYCKNELKERVNGGAPQRWRGERTTTTTTHADRREIPSVRAGPF